METSKNSEKCIVCRKNKKIDQNITNWKYDDDICRECNDYLMHYSPFFQVEYIGGFSKFHRKISGTVLIQNFDDIKRIGFFSHQFPKLEIPANMIKKLEIVKLSQNIKNYSSNRDYGHSGQFLQITFMDGIKIETPIFRVNKINSLIREINILCSQNKEYETQKIEPEDLITAIKTAKKEIQDNFLVEKNLNKNISNHDEPLLILKKRVALGEISENEFEKLKRIIEI